VRRTPASWKWWCEVELLRDGEEDSSLLVLPLSYGDIIALVAAVATLAAATYAAGIYAAVIALTNQVS
jgi:hypothetical protein